MARTVPPSEQVKFRKLASNNFSVSADRIDLLSSAVADAAAKILGKNLSEYKWLRVDDRGQVTMLTGKTATGVEYSEFHFGAGESSVIRMVIQIESLQDGGLILVEEIENGLHPVATHRMVEYLIDVAARKRAQVIFTTHSDAALDVLPPKAIWAAFDGQVLQGKLSVASLRTITGQVEACLAVFVEDNFAEEWLRMAMRLAEIEPDLIQIHAVQGDGTALTVSRAHNQDPTRKFPSLAYIDGDSRQADDASLRVFRLPGGSPERHVFDHVMVRLDVSAAKLAAGLQLPVDRQQEVADVAKDVQITARDPHVIFSQIGERLGLISEAVVRGAFLSLWGQLYPDELEAVVSPIRKALAAAPTAS